MKSRHIFVIALYCAALAIILSWLVLFPIHDLTQLSSKGFRNIQSLPEGLRPLFKGFPNIITLVCYVMFSLTAFLFIKEKRMLYRFISISSFVMLAWLFLCLF